MNKLYMHRFAEKLELLGYTKRSVKEYRYRLKWFLQYMEEREGITNMEDITPAHLSGYHTHLQYEPRGNGSFLDVRSVRGYLFAVKTLLRIFYEEGFWSEDLSHQVLLPKSRQSLPRNIPSVKEVNTLLNAARPTTPIGIRDRCMLELLYATAIRAEELLTLPVDNVNLGDKTLFVHGKGAKDRVIPIGDWVLPFLLNYMENVRPNLMKNGSAAEVLFVSMRSGKPLCSSNLHDLFARYLKKTALTNHVSAHTLRHACATHMLHGGADIRYIQDLLGHNSLSTTQIYTKVDIGDLKKAHKKYHPRERTDDVE